MTEPLLLAALKARENAYAPFSKFHVGAALEDEDGRICRANMAAEILDQSINHAEMLETSVQVSGIMMELLKRVIPKLRASNDDRPLVTGGLESSRQRARPFFQVPRWGSIGIGAALEDEEG